MDTITKTNKIMTITALLTELKFAYSQEKISLDAIDEQLSEISEKHNINLMDLYRNFKAIYCPRNYRDYKFLAQFN